MPRILGLDFGTKRVGAALSDPGRSMATPLEVYARVNASRDAAHYLELVKDYQVDRIVIGLPLHTTGEEGKSAALAREWGGWLSQTTGLPVVYFDERFSTVEAEELLRSTGVKAARRPGKRDMVAAHLLLQAYLDSGAPLHDSLPLGLDDAEPCR
jgi:putative holliday junction resolvase